MFEKSMYPLLLLGALTPLGYSQAIHPTLVDGVITYAGEDGMPRQIEIGKRCADLWVAPDKSAFAFIAIDRFGGWEDSGETVAASTLYIARRADHYAPF